MTQVALLCLSMEGSMIVSAPPISSPPLVDSIFDYLVPGASGGNDPTPLDSKINNTLVGKNNCVDICINLPNRYVSIRIFTIYMISII